jgi:hypothetical protein
MADTDPTGADADMREEAGQSHPEISHREIPGPCILLAIANGG